jgi:hypothetical protein
MAASTTDYERVATAIVEGQVKIMGAAAQAIASKVTGLEYIAGTGARISSANPTDVIEALVQEFSRITGPLGMRLCWMSAQGVLQQHPDIRIPSFARY